MLVEVFQEIIEVIVRLYGEYEPIIKFISYVVSPTLALLAFLWNRQDRKALLKQGQQLGQSRAQAVVAQEAAAQKERDVVAAQNELNARRSDIDKLLGDLKGITEHSQELWKLRPARPFPEYRLWLRDPACPRAITFANFKGGVGKTTLAANFGAYISEKRKKRVLIVDLDFQGSLSNMLMLAAEQEIVASRVDELLESSEEDGLARVSRAKVQIVPPLPRVWLIPASYTLAQMENRLLLTWLLNPNAGVDVRYRLAKALLTPSLHTEFDVIVFDTPPRTSLCTINALVASHWFVVPTGLDKLSAEAVPQFISHLKDLKGDLELDIELAGIAGMMSRMINLNTNEMASLERAREGGYLWRQGEDFILNQSIPRRAAIADAAGSSIAYFQGDGAGNQLSSLFDPLFSEICDRMRLN